MLYNSSCVTVPAKWGNTRFLVDFYVLPISCADVILGIQRLKSLGMIVTDYNSLPTQLQWEGTPISLSHLSREVIPILHRVIDLLKEPQDLPPTHSNSHHIRLVPNTILLMCDHTDTHFSKKKKLKLKYRKC